MFVLSEIQTPFFTNLILFPDSSSQVGHDGVKKKGNVERKRRK
jgi:hypothetical protein